MKVSLGICAVNEEKNIGYLLNLLLKQEKYIKEIIVICDGSSDKTPDIVKNIISNNRSKIIIKLILNRMRLGKSAAVNLFLKNATSEILVLESADNYPAPDAIKKLVTCFEDNKVGVVTARLIPQIDSKGFVGFLGNFITGYLHHKISSENPKFCELIAFRKILNKIPLTSVDEECIGMIIKRKGYKSLYEPDAVAYNKPPHSLKDFIIQRRRINVGHLELKLKFNHTASTLPASNILKHTLIYIKEKPSKTPYVFLAILVELFVRSIAIADVLIFKKKHYKWKIAKTTKDITPASFTKN